MPAIGCGIGVAFGIQVPRSGPIGFDPSHLFANGEPGVWYDPSDLATLFRDAAGTVPVTASGQPVVLMRDKSGRGNDLTLANAALNDAGGLRSIVFNGFSASGVSGSIDFTGTDQVTVWAGLRKIGDGSAGTVTELSPGPANSGTFTLSGPGTANVANYAFRSQGTIPRFATTAANFPAVTTNVVTGIGDISGDTVAIRVDGAQQAVGQLDQGLGPYGDYPLYVGARNAASAFFTGNLYGLIVRGAASSPAEVASTEQYMAGKSGVVL